MERADVLLEAFVPGVMDRLGLGYQVASEINPMMIYCSISGYGQSGPKRSRSGYDACAQAECGIMQATGLDDGPAIRTGTAFVDYSTGMFAAMGVAFALLGRERNGRGEHIDVSLLDSALSHMSHWVTGYSMTGSDPPRSMSKNVPVAPYDIFPTKDTALFIATLKQRHWRSLCEVLGVLDLANDPKFDTSEKRVENRDEMLELLRGNIREFNSEELQEKLAEIGIPCAPVNKISQVVSDGHLQARGTIFEKVYPRLGPIKYVRNPIRLSGATLDMRRNAPLLGEHTAEILQELGYRKDETKNLLDRNVIGSAEIKRTEKTGLGR
jgi:crotonobetainyl-CoA:carnitine CoA-transferase CaiB-like acyl-CoA transferase